MADYHDDSGQILADPIGINGVASGGTGANLSATGPGLLQQASLGSAVTVTLAPSGLSFDLSTMTLTGTIAQFNAALSNGDFATLAGVEVLTNKTLTTPMVNTSIQIAGGTLPAFGSSAWIGNEAGVGQFIASAGPIRFYVNGSSVTEALYIGVNGHPRWPLSDKRVTTQFNKTSDTTLANVTGLSVTLTTGLAYRIEADLFTSSNVGGGVKFAIGGTATATSIVYEGMTYSGGTITQTRATALGTEVGGVTAVTAAYHRITGTIVVNAAGTLTVQFAQNASNGTASSVLVNSTFRVVGIA